MLWRYLITFVTLVASASVGANQSATRPISTTINDLNGVAHRPLDPGSATATVILFISVDCPISNGYAPEITRLCKEFEPQRVTFYLVHTDPALSEASAKKHAAEYGFICPVLIDRRHELVKQLGVSVTPEAAVIAKDGTMAYRGRIDDLYVALGKRRFEARIHDLHDALRSVLAGKPVASPRTTAVGCSIVDN